MDAGSQTAVHIDTCRETDMYKSLVGAGGYQQTFKQILISTFNIDYKNWAS